MNHSARNTLELVPTTRRLKPVTRINPLPGFAKRTQIRTINITPKRKTAAAVIRKSRIAQPSIEDLHSSKMIENQWFAIDVNLAIAGADVVVHPIPWSHIGALVAQHNQFRVETTRPGIQIF